MISTMHQLVFNHGDEKIAADGTITQTTAIRSLRGSLPDGMFGRLFTETAPDGRVTVTSVVQARSRHGKRYNTIYTHDIAEAQKRLLKWAARVLRERTKAGA